MTNQEVTHYKQMITTLEKYGDLFNGLPAIMIDMSNGDYPCDSPCCVGGWVAFYNIGKSDSGGNVYYRKGTEILAKEMGFRYQNGLEDFFYEHTDIWGNDSSRYMFSEEFAYNEGGKKYGYGTLTTTAIANKFFAVASRLRKVIGMNIVLEKNTLMLNVGKKVEAQPELVEFLAEVRGRPIISIRGGDKDLTKEN